jgi:hypothetical protein
MSDNFYDGFDESASDEINSGMNMNGGRIELPFATPYIWFSNGRSDLEELGGVRFFGGWATDAEQLLDEADTWGESEAPSYMQRLTIKAKNSKPLDSFISRSITVAPIANRTSWFVSDQAGNIQRSADYFQGARKHIQILVMMATKVEYFKEDGTTKANRLSPWGPAVLSAKGIQAGNMADSFSKWQATIEKERKASAPKVSPWFFWTGLGTYGEKPVFKTVGTGNNTSLITPIEAYIPATVDAALLRTLFVGVETSKQMATYKLQAREWLEAWGRPTPRGEKAAPLVETHFPGAPEDDIPF